MEKFILHILGRTWNSSQITRDKYFYKKNAKFFPSLSIYSRRSSLPFIKVLIFHYEAIK